MPMDDKTLKSIPTLNLAFIGDGVYDLLVREYLVTHSSAHVGELNKLKVDMVNCKSQAEYMKLIVDSLTEEELDVYKRGRNTRVNSVPKNANRAQYHAATGLESLFGWLYLQGQTDRLNQLFELMMREEG